MSEYNKKSCNRLQRLFYRPIEAAIRWCGLVEHEKFILDTLAAKEASAPVNGQFPDWPCLETNTLIIFDAINHGEIPRECKGKPVPPSDHVSPLSVTVRHDDLRQWMMKHKPGQKPEFLFDETERTTHAAINADSFRALQADLSAARSALVATQKDLEREQEIRKKISREKDSLLGERNSLKAMVENPNYNKLNPSEKKSLIKLVFAMACDAYSYDPEDKKSTIPSELVTILARNDLDISDDTARKWLKEGKKLRDAF